MEILYYKIIKKTILSLREALMKYRATRQSHSLILPKAGIASSLFQIPRNDRQCFYFNVTISRLYIHQVIAPAKPSAIGKAIHTPNKPQKCGRIITSGINKIT